MYWLMPTVLDWHYEAMKTIKSDWKHSLLHPIIRYFLYPHGKVESIGRVDPR